MVYKVRTLGDILTQNEDIKAKTMANKSSYIDLQNKLKMQPAIQNNIDQLKIESKALLDRAKARASLLEDQPELVAKQEAMLLDMETDTIKLQRRSQELGAIAAWRTPVTTTNKEQFFQHLENSGISYEEYGYSKDMTPAELGILNQTNTDIFTHTQQQLQAKDLEDVQQQHRLDRDQQQQYYAMQQNLQKFTFDLALQRERLAAEVQIRQQLASGAPDIDRRLVVWEDEREFGDTFKKAMRARFPNAKWVDDEDVLNNLSGHAYKTASGSGQRAYIDWKSGKAGIPNTKGDYFDNSVEGIIQHVGLDGKYYDDLNARQLQKDREKFGKAFLANPRNVELMSNFIQYQAQQGVEVTEDDFIQMAYGRGDFRGYTPADPFQIGIGVDSNIPIKIAPAPEKIPGTNVNVPSARF